jgi:hypothetical protein
MTICLQVSLPEVLLAHFEVFLLQMRYDFLCHFGP